ncbi:MAG: helix-turn-helix domain-containing protein [Planctomycetales bacterium]|nr:helix-turn-helix domain-containing protein [Planctomycetales bacterium]
MDEREVLRRFAAAVRAARRKRGMTQEGLGFAAELDRVSVARIEAGSLNATLRTVARLAKALGIRPRALLP